MPIRFGPVEQALERGLDVAAQRHRLIASNVANIDTPGYKPAHLSFEQALVSVEGAAPPLALARTSEKHLAAASETPTLSIDLTARRPDGNAVDPEREMRDLARNGIEYATLTQALAGRYRALRAAITEGR